MDNQSDVDNIRNLCHLKVIIIYNDNNNETRIQISFVECTVYLSPSMTTDTVLDSFVSEGMAKCILKAKSVT